MASSCCWDDCVQEVSVDWSSRAGLSLLGAGIAARGLRGLGRTGSGPGAGRWTGYLNAAVPSASNASACGGAVARGRQPVRAQGSASRSVTVRREQALAEAQRLEGRAAGGSRTAALAAQPAAPVAAYHPDSGRSSRVPAHLLALQSAGELGWTPKSDVGAASQRSMATGPSPGTQATISTRTGWSTGTRSSLPTTRSSRCCRPCARN